jgi:hypothetical protein
MSKRARKSIKEVAEIPQLTEDIFGYIALFIDGLDIKTLLCFIKAKKSFFRYVKKKLELLVQALHLMLPNKINTIQSFLNVQHCLIPSTEKEIMAQKYNDKTLYSLFKAVTHFFYMFSFGKPNIGYSDFRCMTVYSRFCTLLLKKRYDLCFRTGHFIFCLLNCACDNDPYWIKTNRSGISSAVSVRHDQKQSIKTTTRLKDIYYERNKADNSVEFVKFKKYPKLACVTNLDVKDMTAYIKKKYKGYRQMVYLKAWDGRNYNETRAMAHMIYGKHAVHEKPTEMTQWGDLVIKRGDFYLHVSSSEFKEEKKKWFVFKGDLKFLKKNAKIIDCIPAYFERTMEICDEFSPMTIDLKIKTTSIIPKQITHSLNIISSSDEERSYDYRCPSSSSTSTTERSSTSSSSSSNDVEPDNSIYDLFGTHMYDETNNEDYDEELHQNEQSFNESF